MSNETLANIIANIINQHIHIFGSDDIIALSIDCLSIDIICSDPEKSVSVARSQYVDGSVLSTNMIIDASAQIVERVESIMPSFKFMTIERGYMSLIFLQVGKKYTITHGGDGDLMIECPNRPPILDVYLEAIDSPSNAFWKLIEDNNGMLEALKCYKHASHKYMLKQVVDKMKEYYSELSDSDKLIYELDI